ncbi:hypothetical protein CPLU01_08082 [Colletotrichum plurivorum]|uniref:Uncharacterized protein n=1 Tax=Colletotrichum plurivorum TaxID=2175906 RepID=A0A8H6KD10_9PEZI|nr:hypothetical protein CPLU01_08082 [Colletotrichum plurivorum]
MPPTSSADDEHEAVLEKLALLALTYEINEWNNEFLKVAEKHLSDADQNFLSNCYREHLRPIVHGSIWWNDDNARIALTVLLPERYPLLATKSWKRNHEKTRGILRTWRKDVARIFPELTEDGFGDDGSDEEEYDLSWQPARNKKRKGDAVQEDPRKNYKKPAISRSESPKVGDYQKARKTANTPFRPKPYAPATGLITPPHSIEGTPVAGSDSDSEDGEPIPMRRRRARPPMTPTQSPPLRSATAAAAYPSPLSISPTCTMASIAPVAASRHREADRIATFEDALKVISRAHNEKEKESNRRIAELGRSVKQLPRWLRS